MASVSSVPVSPHASEHDHDHDSEMDHDHDDLDDHDDDHHDDIHSGGIPRDPVAAGILPPPRQRACASCARLKIKCGWPKADDGVGSVSVSDGRPCIRCARLKIKCQIPDRVKRKKKIRTTRVSQLEEKIDGIVNLLAAHNATSQTSPPTGAVTLSTTGAGTTSSSTPQAHPTPPTSTNAATSIASLLSHPNAKSPPSQGGGARPAPPKLDEDTKWSFLKNTVLPSPVSRASPDSTGSDTFVIELSSSQNLTVSATLAARYLCVYHDEYVPVCPLVTPLSSEMLHPATLHSSAPLLFWAIVASVAPLDGPIQVEFRRWFRTRAADFILISPMSPAHPDHRGTGLAVLQAILVHAAWCDSHGFVDSHITSLLHLALALIAELRLDRPHVFKDAVAKNLIKDACSVMTAARAPHQFPVIVGIEERTLAECRAAVGFYCLASILLQRTGHPMAYSPAIAHFIKALLNANEFPTDRLLVAAAQMMAAVEPIIYGSLSRDRISDPHSNIEFTEPIHMVIQQTKKDVDAIAESYDESITSQIPFRLFYLGTLIRLYEPVISVRATPSTAHARATTLWNTLIMAETVLETFIAIPPPSFIIQPITTMITIGPSMMSMARLLLLDFPFPSHTASMADLARGWDAAAARNRFDFVEITGRMAEAMEKADNVARNEGGRIRVLSHGGSALGSNIDKMRWIRRWFYAKLHGQRGGAAEDEKGEEEGEGSRGCEDGGEMAEQQQQQQPQQPQQQPLPLPRQPQYPEQQQQPYEQPPNSLPQQPYPYPRPPNLQPYQQTPQQQFDPQSQPYQFYHNNNNTNTNNNGTYSTPPMGSASAAAAVGTSDFALSWLEGLGLGAGAVDLSGMDPNFFQSLMDDVMMGVPQAGFSGV